jgi:hypothetical protein
MDADDLHLCIAGMYNIQLGILPRWPKYHVPRREAGVESRPGDMADRYMLCANELLSARTTPSNTSDCKPCVLGASNVNARIKYCRRGSGNPEVLGWMLARGVEVDLSLAIARR